jgi:hypothetical protein
MHRPHQNTQMLIVKRNNDTDARQFLQISQFPAILVPQVSQRSIHGYFIAHQSIVAIFVENSPIQIPFIRSYVCHCTAILARSNAMPLRIYKLVIVPVNLDVVAIVSATEKGGKWLDVNEILLNSEGFIVVLDDLYHGE